MNEPPPDKTPPFEISAGARWVERYLLPLIAVRREGALGRKLTFLQIEPDNEDEANRLRRDGHRCDILLCDAAGSRQQAWQQPPIMADPTDLPLQTGHYDLVLTGAFGRLTGGIERRIATAREMARVCGDTGAVLLTLGNRLCPLDLSGNTTRLHGPWDRALATLGEIEQIFLGECHFRSVSPLGLAGHFGWSTCVGTRRIAAGCLEAYLRWSTSPSRRWLYASALNPMLSLWIDR